MLKNIAMTALAAWATVGSPLWGAEPATSSGPPAWQDGSSIYLTMHDPPKVPAEQHSPVARPDERRLAPPSSAAKRIQAQYGNQQNRAENAVPRAQTFSLPPNAVYTVLSALAIVVGAFLLCAWMLRRGSRGLPQTLPAEVVSVLGRVPIEARQFAQLLRIGNKLVLYAMTPSGPETLTEVTDPVEVDRIVGLCQQSHPHSTTKAFEQVFRQLSRDPAPSEFLSGGLPPAPPLPSLDMFRSQLGEAARA
jgi:flagellar biogenesis protein FliO